MILLVYINNLPKNIFRLLENTYADDNTMYGCGYKQLKAECPAADLPSKPSLAQCGKFLPVSLKTFKSMLQTFYQHKADPDGPF